jgi:hypothetical protein
VLASALRALPGRWRRHVRLRAGREVGAAGEGFPGADVGQGVFERRGDRIECGAAEDQSLRRRVLVHRLDDGAGTAARAPGCLPSWSIIAVQTCSSIG